MNDTDRVQIKRNGTGSILVILGLIAIMVMFMESMLIPALPMLQAEFSSTAMNTLFRTTGGVVGPTIAGVFLAQYVSPLIIQTPRGHISGPLLPNATAFNYIFLTALGISIVGVLVTLLVNSRAGEIEVHEPVEEGAAAS